MFVVCEWYLFSQSYSSYYKINVQCAGKHRKLSNQPYLMSTLLYLTSHWWKHIVLLSMCALTGGKHEPGHKMTHCILQQTVLTEKQDMTTWQLRQHLLLTHAPKYGDTTDQQPLIMSFCWPTMQSMLNQQNQHEIFDLAVFPEVWNISKLSTSFDQTQVQTPSSVLWDHQDFITAHMMCFITTKWMSPMLVWVKIQSNSSCIECIQCRQGSTKYLTLITKTLLTTIALFYSAEQHNHQLSDNL